VIETSETWERDVNSSLKSTENSGIHQPRKICGCKHKNSAHLIAQSIHLLKDLRFDSSRGLVVTSGAISAHGVNFVNEDDAWFPLHCHLEQSFDDSAQCQTEFEQPRSCKKAYRSDSPNHFETRSAALIEKNTLSTCVATAFARRVFAALAKNSNY
jgi:hypothetical protein